MDTRSVSVITECPKCHNECGIKIEVAADPATLAPDVRGELIPVEALYKYKFTSTDIANFILKQARERVSNIKLQVVPLYCEKKRRKPNELHHSYATLRIAFSDSSIEKKEDMGWYGKLGDQNHVHLVQSLFDDIVKRYSYNVKELDKLMESYAKMERIEDGLGMTEEFIHDIKMYASPKRITAKDNTVWVFFSAAPEIIIADMLSDVTTGKPIGKIDIHDVYPINKDTVEFEVWVSPHEIEMKENPHVRQILMGEEKGRK